MSDWFQVDLKGLSQLIEDQGAARLLTELVRNSLDEDGVTTVKIEVNPVPGRPLCTFTVTDDAPGGFHDLSHAYTLFAPSYKKTHADKAGRFNLGDKLVVAAALMTGEPVTISSTAGTIVFDEAGRHRKHAKTDAGSVVSGHLKITRDQFTKEVVPLIKSLILPEGVTVTFNDEVLPVRKPVLAYEAKLLTPLADDDGVPRNRLRDTTVTLYDPLDETGGVYELGVPVVAVGDKWVYNVGQKVPLSMQRDNVPPSFLRTLRVLTFNKAYPRLTQEDANSPWVREAMGDDRAAPDAVKATLDLRFGNKRVAYDPSDPEANRRATAEGFTVVQGRMLNSEEWVNVRKTNSTPPAGRVFPTPKPYSNDPNAPAVKVVERGDWTDAMKRVVRFTEYCHKQVFGDLVTVRIVDTKNNFLAAYASLGAGQGEFDYNLGRLEASFFEAFNSKNLLPVVELMIHEFAHQRSSDHLSGVYHDALCEVGAKLFRLAVSSPFSIEEILE